MAAAKLPEPSESAPPSRPPGGFDVVSTTAGDECQSQTVDSMPGLPLNGHGGRGVDTPDETSAASETFIYDPGVAAVKKEYLVKPGPRAETVDDDALEQSERERTKGSKEASANKRGKGQNKGRRFKRNRDEIEFCPFLDTAKGCTYTEKCRYGHDREEYLRNKPADIGPRCYIFETYGKCRYGIRCRFAGAHIMDGENMVDEEKRDRMASRAVTSGGLTGELLRQLRKRAYDYKRAPAILRELEAEAASHREEQKRNVERTQAAPTIAARPNNSPLTAAATKESFASDASPTKRMKVGDGGTPVDALEGEGHVIDHSRTVEASNVWINLAAGPPEASGEGTSPTSRGSNHGVGMVQDVGKVAALLPREKKATINFKGKLYLAPLTTVGNLPFRRLCKTFGADITCGEMAMAQQIVMGHKAEWALLKRHPSEDIYGVQIAGNKPDLMVKAAELISEYIDCDFVDVNMGCPIDLVYNQGAGSALMETPGKLGRMLRGMNAVLDVPLTIKFRMGVHTGHPTAHKLIPKVRDWGCALGSLHGRSRQQRYTKLANWDYIGECVKAAGPMPLFGNGDVLTFREYCEKKEKSGVAGIMLGRGPLIKPWLFTEIKEGRDWDISATERLEIFRKFCDFGLDHWGSDTVGVNATRRFLCEWQSFTHRYVPLGLLERGYLPSMNDRPPLFRGRNDLECLLASTDAADWVKVSEMFLGKAPDTFNFVPKHKANSYNVNQG